MTDRINAARDALAPPEPDDPPPWPERPASPWLVVVLMLFCALFPALAVVLGGVR